MLNELLRRLLGRTPDVAAPALPAAGPLTVLAAEAPPAVELLDIDHLFVPWLLGAGVAQAQELNETESRMLRALKREADNDDMATAELVPRLPAIIPVLLRSMRDRNVSNAELAAQVAQDAVLVAAVLRQVNSAWFRRTDAVKTIEEALAIIGQNGLRILVASVAFKPLFNPGLGPCTGIGAPRVWALSEPTGLACRILAGRSGADEFEVFLAGLLRSVGIIVALRLLDQTGGATPASLRSLAFHTGFIHYCRRLAALIGRAWAFPPAAVAAAARSHSGDDTVLQVLAKAERLAKLRVLRQAGALREELADAFLDTEELNQCWRDMARRDRAEA